MSRIAVAALVLVSTGCATTGAGGREGNATIAGVVRLPESGMQQVGSPCDQLQVVVSSPSAPSQALGRAMVKASSRGSRCSFTVSSLPSGEELQVGVAADSGLKCDNGATPTITPAPSAVTLGNYSTVTRDFALSCGA